MTDLRITGPNGDGEYWLHIKAGGKMGGLNLGSEHGPLAQRLLDAAAIEAPAQEPVAQCCMCGKGGVSTAEDGTPGCELPDGRWVCSGECWDRAASWPVPDPTQPDHLTAVERAAYERGVRDAAAKAYEVAHNTNDISKIRDAILAMIPEATHD